MGETTALINIDFKQLFLSVFVIILAIKVLGTAFEWIVVKLGLETKFSRKHKEVLETVDEHKTSIEDLQKQDVLLEAKIDSLETKIDKLTTVVTEGQIQSMRSEILDAACRLGRMDYTEEQYNHLFEVHTRYEEILKANKLTNGQVSVSFKFIEQRYQEQLKKGF